MKRALLFALVVACYATSASAQLKIGYIDSEVLKERLPEFRDAQR
ncbi:MAG: OmpH family outer membrane protein, partial [Gemmatimonadetes bacterium]|nr:OmpH family outer membrane protein [Gemmatimonadota bacterium]